MNKYLQLILDWAEVWPLLLPLVILLFIPLRQKYLKPVALYVPVAFVINLLGDLIADYHKELHFPSWLSYNTPLYNIHSVIRFACFSYFFIAIHQSHFNTLKKILPVVSLVFILINFGFFENFFDPEHISGNLLTAEAYLLLIYCMLYYLSELRNENDVVSHGADFWITTGLSIYVVVNFFVFLFYNPMVEQNLNLADKIWDVHNIAYIIFCFFIAKAFYVPASN